MILAFGGTTEGKELLTLLNEVGERYVYSTKTKVDVQINEKSSYVFGPMESVEIEHVISNNHINFVVDASHPFASSLHNNIITAAKNKHIPCYRIERTPLLREKHRLIHYVPGYKEIINIVDAINPKVIIALTGVQSIYPLTPVWKKYNLFLRILPKNSSLALAERQQFKKEQLLTSLPGKSVEEEIALIEKLKANLIITKETGYNGGLPIKISAAKNTNTPIIILKQPKTKGYNKIFKQINELTPYLNQNILS